jgi:hypothetical protein
VARGFRDHGIRVHGVCGSNEPRRRSILRSEFSSSLPASRGSASANDRIIRAENEHCVWFRQPKIRHETMTACPIVPSVSARKSPTA